MNVHKTFRRRPGRLVHVLCTFSLRPCVYGDHNIKENEIKLSHISRAKSHAAFWRMKKHFKSFGISRYYTEQKKMIKASPHGNVNCNLFRCKGGTTAKITNLSKMNRKINDICIRENTASCCLPFIAKGCPGVEVGHGREGISFKHNSISVFALLLF